MLCRLQFSLICDLPTLQKVQIVQLYCSHGPDSCYIFQKDPIVWYDKNILPTDIFAFIWSQGHIDQAN